MIGGDRRADAAIAIVIALVVIALSPGLAFVALVAIVVLVVCGASIALEHRPGGGRRRRRVRTPTSRRSRTPRM